MINAHTFFTIVVPTYNRAHLLPKTIENILQQTYGHYEIIIVDDGSTDNTEDVIQKYISEKVHYYKKTNAERAAARNYGTIKAIGDYINWNDSDDLMKENNLEEAAKLVQKTNNPELFAVGYQYIDTTGKLIYESNFSDNINQDLYKGNQFAMNSMFVRRDIALANLFNEDLELSASEDYELWLRLAAKYKIYTCEARTALYIWHDERSTVTMRDPTQLIKRYTKFLYYSTTNPEVLLLLGKHKKTFLMKNYLILAVDLAINRYRFLSVKYLAKGFVNSPALVFERGFFAFAKYFFKSLLPK